MKWLKKYLPCNRSYEELQRYHYNTNHKTNQHQIQNNSPSFIGVHCFQMNSKNIRQFTKNLQTCIHFKKLILFLMTIFQIFDTASSSPIPDPWERTINKHNTSYIQQIHIYLLLALHTVIDYHALHLTSTCTNPDPYNFMYSSTRQHLNLQKLNLVWHHSQFKTRKPRLTLA